MNGSKGKAKGEERGYLSIVYDFFRSLKLTITLLILLAVISIIGTLISQNVTPTEYIQRYGISLYEVLDFFGLFDMYHSWWFSAILLFLVLNLIACSAQRFPGVWGQVFRRLGTEGLEDAALKTLPYVERIKPSSPGKALTEESIRSSLRKGFGKPRRIETESTVTLFSEKGKFSRLGSYITHLSLLIILTGGMIGSIYGFRGFVNILEGETVNQISLRGKQGDILKPIGFSIRCDDFHITFYDLPGRSKERYVKEYTSNLTILEDGKEVMKKTVVVNHPLHYGGLAFYQSSYGALNDISLGIQWKKSQEKSLIRVLEGETSPIPNSDAMVRVLNYAPQVHNFGEGVQVVLFKPNQEPQAFWLLRGASTLGEQANSEFTLSFQGLTSREYTGLQVTKDPGVWIVWFGCALMISGLIISFFFSHQRIWVRIPRGEIPSPGGDIVLAGSANKNRIGFERTFQSLAESIRSLGR